MSKPTPKLTQLALSRLTQLVSLALGLWTTPVLTATARMPTVKACPADRKQVKAPIPKKRTQLVSLATGKQVGAIPKAQMQWTRPWRTHTPLLWTSTMTIWMTFMNLTFQSPQRWINASPTPAPIGTLLHLLPTMSAMPMPST